MASIKYQSQFDQGKEVQMSQETLARIISAAMYNLRNLKKLEGPQFPNTDSKCLDVCIDMYSDIKQGGIG